MAGASVTSAELASPGRFARVGAASAMSTKFHAIIIGGGPAGGFAALRLAQLGWPGLEGLACWLLAGGMLALAAALAAGSAGWIRAAGVAVALGAAAFALSLARTLHHLSPCGARASAAGAVGAGTRSASSPARRSS